MDDIQLVYIAGYGRSGSTILDTLLGNHPQVLGAGELTWLFELAVAQQACTCGDPIGRCPVWSAVVPTALQRAGGVSSSQAAALTRYAEQHRRPDKVAGLYERLWQGVFDAIQQQTGCGWIVDSSKSTRRNYYRLEHLQAIPRVQLFVIHLVRDPRGVMWSIRRGSNRRIEAGQTAHVTGSSARALASWIVANRNVEQFRKRNTSAKYLRVRYEDLVLNTDAILQTLGQFLGCDLRAVMDALRQRCPLSPGHGISGNRTRRSGSLQLRVDNQWQAHLPYIDRALARLAAPWLRQYEYAISIPSQQ